MPKSIVNLGLDVERHILFDAGALATGTSDFISVAGAHSFCLLVAMGTNDGALDVLIQEATDSSGTGAQTLTVHGTDVEITQLGATDDNKLAVVEVTVDALSAGFTHIAADLTVTGGTGTDGFVLLEINPGKKPATQGTEVNEVLTFVG